MRADIANGLLEDHLGRRMLTGIIFYFEKFVYELVNIFLNFSIIYFDTY